jgi:hypothetical protein
MPELNTALVEINRQNREFWELQKRLTEARLADEAVLATAVESIGSELQRRVPVYFQKTFDTALAEADNARQRFLTQLGRRGGTAKKCDALQQLIMEIVCRRPSITKQQLLARLRDQRPIPPIIDVDDETIYFTSRGNKEAGAKISGLKDRLSRAKKQLRTRRNR